MTTIDAIIGFFQTGGPFMYPILFILALGIAIAVERFLYLNGVEKRTRHLWGEVAPLLGTADGSSLVRTVEGRDTALARVLDYGFSRFAADGRRADVETAMEEGLMEVMPGLERRTHYLATFANIATLLGLLGTIIGLIQAFTAVAGADPAEKADLLSASISVAMNTTAFGLMAAIPLLLVHTVLQTKTAGVVDSLETVSLKALNSLTLEREGRAA